MSTLIVKFSADSFAAAQGAEPVHSALQFDYLLTPDGRSIATQSRAAASVLPPMQHGDVVALLAPQLLSWHQVTLPKGSLKGLKAGFSGNPGRLRAILEGLLEEHLLDDMAQLHFALGPTAQADAARGAPIWVAVCDRHGLRACVQALEQSGLPVSRIVPEFAPDAGSLHVRGSPETAQMVFSRAEAMTGGVSGAVSGALNVLPLSPASVAWAAWPAESGLVAEPAVAALAESLFKRPVVLQQAGQRWLVALDSGWDVAQFELANSGNSRWLKQVNQWFQQVWQAPRWRAARVAALALMAVNLVGLNAWAWAQHASVQAKKQAIEQLLQGSFPQVKVVVDAPLQMAKEVALLRQATGGASATDFDQLLSGFALLPSASHALLAIDYKAGEMRIKGHGLVRAQLEAAQPQLASKGLWARLEGDVLSVTAAMPALAVRP